MGRRLVSLGLLLGLAMFLWGCGDDDEVAPVAPVCSWPTPPVFFDGTWTATSTPYTQLGGLITAGAITSSHTGVSGDDPCAAPVCVPILEWCATFVDACDPEMSWKVDGTINTSTGAMTGVSRDGQLRVTGVAALLADCSFGASGTFVLTIGADVSQGNWQVSQL